MLPDWVSVTAASGSSRAEGTRACADEQHGSRKFSVSVVRRLPVERLTAISKFLCVRDPASHRRRAEGLYQNPRGNTGPDADVRSTGFFAVFGTRCRAVIHYVSLRGCSQLELQKCPFRDERRYQSGRSGTSWSATRVASVICTSATTHAGTLSSSFLFHRLSSSLCSRPASFSVFSSRALTSNTFLDLCECCSSALRA